MCLAILVFWLVAASALFTRDLLPNLIIGAPPDLRSIAQADDRPRQTRWAILVADEGPSINLRSVGQATTETIHKRDGWVRMSSDAWFDSGKLLRGTAFQTVQGERIELLSNYEITPSGNLEGFHAAVRDGPAPRQEMLTLDGRLIQNAIEVRAKGFLQIMNWTRTFPYQPRGMVQNAIGPLDRMPGLQVGQRWESRIVSPLTGQVETCQVEVARKRSIYWDSNLVSTFEVVAKTPLVTARTWVQPDGLVLRQEVPLPFVKLVLERQPENTVSSGKLP
jgi:hypothetical protein